MIQALVQNISLWDVSITIRIYGWKKRRPLDIVMLGASYLGDGYFYCVLGILFLLFTPPDASKALLAGALAFALELPLHGLLKNMTRRSRPFIQIPGIVNRIKPPDKFSFPSGHTAGAFLMATIFGSVYPSFMLPAFLIASIIGFSRIYNGVHYTSDVIAGLFLGITCAELALFIVF